MDGQHCILQPGLVKLLREAEAEAEAEINMKDNDGLRALYIAAKNKAVTKLLLEAEGDVN